MRREIVVNARFLSRRVSGVERYGREILAVLGDDCRLEQTRLNGLPGHLWEQLILPGKMRRDSILWSPANTGPLAVRNQALTIHDLSPLEHPGWFKSSFSLAYRLFLPALARRVRVVFTPSQYVKQKIGSRLGAQNIVVTANGVNRQLFHPLAQRSKYSLPAEYILFVGTMEPRKNLSGLIHAWNQIKADFQEVWLVIAGVPGTVFKTVSISAEQERICFLGYVDEEQLPGLYTGASVFVLPSFEEGFGLPVVEAMACGTPVIGSDAGALPEVIGEAGLIFKLSEPESLARMMKESLLDPSLRLSLRQKGLERAQSFSWQKTASLIRDSLYAI